MILDMKKATIYCMQEDQEQLLKKLQQFGWFMPEERGAQSSEASETKARLARAQVLSLKDEAYVYAARLSGCSSWEIMTKTLLPNMLGPMVVNASTQIGTMMIGIAGLSFLGIGVMEPQAEWGSMINGSRAYLQLAPWAVLAPAFATIITVMIFNYLGDCIRDVLDVEVAK